MKKYSRLAMKILIAAMVLSFASVSFAAPEKAAGKDAKAGGKDTKAKKKKKKKKAIKLKVGDTIKNFTLPDGITKNSISFDKDIKGKSKVIVITFMTTACSACKAELNLLSDLANKYGDAIQVYAVSVDLNGEKSIPSYDSAFGFNIRYLLDPDFKIPQTFGFTFTPSLVVTNGEGKITFMKGGYSPSTDPDVIIKAVKDVLK